MARTFRKQASRFDHDQVEKRSNHTKHPNNHVTGGIKLLNSHEDEFIEEEVFDKFGVRIRNIPVGK